MITALETEPWASTAPPGGPPPDSPSLLPPLLLLLFFFKQANSPQDLRMFYEKNRSLMPRYVF